MNKVTDSCPSCGRPKPSGESCPFCVTVADVDIKRLQSEHLSGRDEDEPLLRSASLVIRKTGERFPLKNRKVKIGRAASNQVSLPEDTYTSRFHAWIIFEDDQFWLEDLGSTNGTLLNGHPVVKRQVLVSGNKIRIGHTDFLFEIDKS